MAKTTYTAEDIKELPFPECVQQRPQMYIGTPDSTGMLTCIREILNNSVDEHLAGHCTHISVIRDTQNMFTITDNGRGVPFDKHESGKNALEVIFGKLHAGRNFTEKTVYSTGINGVGGSCVNALSSIFSVQSTRGNDSAQIIFDNGHKDELDLKAPKMKLGKEFSKSSTMVIFELNPEYFEEDSFVEPDILETLVRETAYLNNELTITLEDYLAEDKGKKVFKVDNGAVKLLDGYIKKPLFNTIGFKPDTISNVKIELAFAYSENNSSEEINSFCNTIKTSDGGTHVTGFKRALSQRLVQYIKEKGLTKEKIESEDVFDGLYALVSVFVFNPKYTSQTKTKLSNTEVNGNVFAYANKALGEWLDTNPKEIKVLAKKIELSAKARIAQKRALDSVRKDTGSTLTSLSNIAKFSDCEEQMSGRTELFICEG
jgi:DNA gyrase subunit B